MFLRAPGMRGCGAEGASVDGTADGADSEVFGFFAFLRKNKDLFWVTLRLLCALISERIDSAMVEAAVRTVRRRSCGSMVSFSSMSDGGGCRLNKDIELVTRGIVKGSWDREPARQDRNRGKNEEWKDGSVRSKQSLCSAAPILACYIRTPITFHCYKKLGKCKRLESNSWRC